MSSGGLEVSLSIDPVHVQQNVGPDLGPNTRWQQIPLADP